MAAQKSIISGERFGRLTIICEVRKRPGSPHRRVSAQCDCGTIADYEMTQLRTGHTKSCGCFGVERRTSHGHAKENSPTYRSWVSMKTRCRDRKGYADRGITICERWILFVNFLADMGERPQGMTIDRINPSGNYEPSNCRWATPSQQANNRRNAHMITAMGKSMTIMEWSKETGIPFHTIRHRLLRGWDSERAVTK